MEEFEVLKMGYTHTQVQMVMKEGQTTRTGIVTLTHKDVVDVSPIRLFCRRISQDSQG
jgi:hypothetical protein